LFFLQKVYRPLTQFYVILNVILKLFENVFVLFDANKMDEKKTGKMRQQIHSQISQSEASLFLGLIQQTHFTSSSRKGLLYVQVNYKLFRYHLQLSLQVKIQVILHVNFTGYKCRNVLISVLFV
jgi:hypothetical protein